MRDEVVERFTDVLQNIEASIMAVYENEADLLDLDVIDALDALVRRYVAEQQDRTPPKLRLSGRATRVFDAAERMCEWRLGRVALGEDDRDAVMPPDERIAVDDLVICLKRIRKSVHTWNEQGGRQGYLSYISNFFV